MLKQILLSAFLVFTPVLLWGQALPTGDTPTGDEPPLSTTNAANPDGTIAEKPGAKGVTGLKAVKTKGAKYTGPLDFSDFDDFNGLKLSNSVWFYNGESDDYWDETRTTITYFANVFEPSYRFAYSRKLNFVLGTALFVPFDQESKVADYYPLVRTELKDDGIEYGLGSLKNDHDLPGPLLDPLIAVVPEVRIEEGKGRKIQTTHGRYEYGAQIRWNKTYMKAEAYLNWQLKDTVKHNERFDVGLSSRWKFFKAIPLYTGLHYWHNGGHEHFHPVEITESYKWALGLRNDDYNLLYVGSKWVPDREMRPELNQDGHAFYIDYNFRFGRWTITPKGFYSLSFQDKKLVFRSIEGEPFFQVPGYAGFDVGYRIPVGPGAEVLLKFIQGWFIAKAGEGFDSLSFRYDQSVIVNLQYYF